jgi:hypothetical protein
MRRVFVESKMDGCVIVLWSVVKGVIAFCYKSIKIARQSNVRSIGQVYYWLSFIVEQAASGVQR